MPLPPRLLPGETPRERGVGGLATVLIGGAFAVQGLLLGKATRQAWPTHQAPCKLGQREPTGGLGHSVHRQVFQEPAGRRRGEGVLQRRGAMGVRGSTTPESPARRENGRRPPTASGAPSHAGGAAWSPR
jgi:hypothetical protein